MNNYSYSIIHDGEIIDMGHEAFQYAPIVVTIHSLEAGNDLAIIPVPDDAKIMSVYGYIKNIEKDTHVVTLKNNAGEDLTSLSWNAAGVSHGEVVKDSIAAGDSIHFNITSLGKHVEKCVITVWLRMASIA